MVDDTHKMNDIEELVLLAQRGDRSACAEIDKAAPHHRDWWTAQRRTGIGGSDWATVLGLNPYKRPIDFWQQAMGHAQPVDESEPMRWGKILEPVIAAEYQRRRGGETACHLGGPFSTERSIARSWHLYTLDRLAVLRNGQDMTRRVLEIKSRGWWRQRDYGDDGTDAVPFAEICQVSCYMAGVDVGDADIAVLFNTHHYEEFHVPRDLNLEGQLLDRLGQWWQDHVVARVPPPADGSDQHGQFLRRRYERTTGALVTADSTINSIAGKLRQVCILERHCSGAREMLEQQLAEHLADADGFQLASGETIKFTSARGRVSQSAVIAELASRLDMGPKQLEALEERHRGPTSRRWNRPRVWSQDALDLGVLPAIVHELKGRPQ
jgi:putative phage-type endonuclease